MCLLSSCCLLLAFSRRSQVLNGSLRKMPDLDRIGKKFLRGKAKLEDVVQVYDAVQKLPVLTGALDAHDSEHAAVLKEVGRDALH